MTFRVFAIPYDSGHEGLRMGAGPLRLQELFAEVEEIHARKDWRAEIRTSFELYGELARRIRDGGDETPVVLSGNCGACAGTVAGLGSERMGVIWFDAHGDLNTPDTTDTGFLDGMALSIVTGQCFRPLAKQMIGLEPLPPANAIHIGGRDWSPGEMEHGRDSGVTIVSKAADAAAAIDNLARSCDRVVIHVDLDVIDPSYGAANQYAAPGGLSPSDVGSIVKSAKKRMRIAALDFASYDPSYDRDGRIVDAVREIVSAAESPQR
jgi:arginase